MQRVASAAASSHRPWRAHEIGPLNQELDAGGIAQKSWGERFPEQLFRLVEFLLFPKGPDESFHFRNGLRSFISIAFAPQFQRLSCTASTSAHLPSCSRVDQVRPGWPAHPDGLRPAACVGCESAAFNTGMRFVQVAPIDACAHPAGKCDLARSGWSSPRTFRWMSNASVSSRSASVDIRSQHPGQVGQRGGHQRMIVAKQPAAHGQHFPRGRFGLRALAAIPENDAKIAQRIRHLQMLVSKQSPPDCQALPRQSLGLGEFFLARYTAPRLLSVAATSAMLVSEKSPPNGEGLLVTLPRLRPACAVSKAPGPGR